VEFKKKPALKKYLIFIESIPVSPERKLGKPLASGVSPEPFFIGEK
jgi:hypothetical protein